MDIRTRLKEGNRRYRETGDAGRRMDTAQNGQHPYAIVVCCSDSRVIPEEIFQAGIGDLFVIRVAGNVLDNHQLGSIEYAAGHLNCGHILVLGHTGCGAVHAALTGGGEGFISFITEDILAAIGMERDEEKACQIYHQMLDTFVTVDEAGLVVLHDCCAVAGLGGKMMRSGTYDYYINEAVVENDPKGMGPLIWAMHEYEQYHENKLEK